MTRAGKLYLVSTPIGNLGDITFRAIEVLKSVDLIACEDTRHSQNLLVHYGIHKPLTSCFEGNESAKTADLVRKIREGLNLALITDAGTPALSDPGFRLTSACIREGIGVSVVPGASSITAALAVAGLPTDSFIFEGFLPPKTVGRQKKMKSWEGQKRTIVFFESPHRIAASLSDLEKTHGDIRIVVARELTKKFEEVLRDRVNVIRERFEKSKPLGEFVVLLNLRVNSI